MGRLTVDTLRDEQHELGDVERSAKFDAWLIEHGADAMEKVIIHLGEWNDGDDPLQLGGIPAPCPVTVAAAVADYNAGRYQTIGEIINELRD